MTCLQKRRRRPAAAASSAASAAATAAALPAHNAGGGAAAGGLRGARESGIICFTPAKVFYLGNIRLIFFNRE